MATAVSKTISRIWVKIKIEIKRFKKGPVFPSKVIKRWPAIIFAIKRIASVPGRIRLLMVSMHTMKGIRIPGVPVGTRWAIIWYVFLIHPKIIKVNHKGKAIDNVKVIWLDLVKI